MSAPHSEIEHAGQAGKFQLQFIKILGVLRSLLLGFLSFVTLLGLSDFHSKIFVPTLRALNWCGGLIIMN